MICALPGLLHSGIGIPVGHVVPTRPGVIRHRPLSLVGGGGRVVGVVVVARDAVASVNHRVVLVGSGVLDHVGGHLWVAVALHLPQGVLGIN